jgi:hypothetical protein
MAVLFLMPSTANALVASDLARDEALPTGFESQFLLKKRATRDGQPIA